MFSLLIKKIYKNRANRRVYFARDELPLGWNSLNHSTSELNPIKSIYKKKFCKEIEFLGEGVCTLDFVEIVENDNVVVTPCKHIFHYKCLKMWVESDTGSFRCPNCKGPFLPFG